MARISAELTEVVLKSTDEAREAALFAEVAAEETALAREAALFAEVAAEDTPLAREAALFAEVSAGDTKAVRVAGLYVEVFMNPREALKTFEWGFEAGNSTFYTDEGWQFWGNSVVAAALHTDLAGNGGAYVANNWRMTSPATLLGCNVLAFWFRFDGARLPITFYKSTVYQFHIVIAKDLGGTVVMYRGNTVVASAPAGSINPNVSHWYSFWFVADPTNGRCILWVDGVQVLDSGTVNTANSGNAGWDQFHYGWNGYSTSGDYWCVFEDIIAAEYYTAAAVPETLIMARVPTSDATPNDFTGAGSGSHYTMVDEIPASTSDYLEGDADGEQELYGLADLPGSGIATVYFVGAKAWAARSGSDLTKGTAWLKSDDISSYPTSVTLNASPANTVVQWTWDQDPDNGGKDWTTSAVNALKAGFKVNT